MLKKYFIGLALFAGISSAQAITPEQALKVMPADCSLVLRAEIKDILTHKPFEEYVQQFKDSIQAKKNNPFTLMGIDLLKTKQIMLGVKFVNGEYGLEPMPYVIFNSSEKIDLAAAQKAFKSPEGEEMKFLALDTKGVKSFEFQERVDESDPMCLVQLDETSVMLMRRPSVEKYAEAKKSEKNSLASNKKMAKQLIENKDALWVYYKPGKLELKEMKQAKLPVNIEKIKGLMAAVKLEEALQKLQVLLFCADDQTPQQLSGLISLFGPQFMEACKLPAENLQSSAVGSRLQLTMKMKKFELVSGLFGFMMGQMMNGDDFDDEGGDPLAEEAILIEDAAEEKEAVKE